ncbi:response regulator [Marivita hallyeonensis]|uniref:Response regulator receiver domain-containing protein n=1 Tax=Marivita hallyeonensis TaxID=996342 RepID=A0A1M5MR05_9RHOB|nr:response regulator [Marivita hallyeonensis]SHG79636.1 Response regulator receiver domain-containing protein [Marivita hallyeonensis]
MPELKTILHVDDDEDILEIAKLSLEVVDNFELYQFNSGAAALEAFDSIAPQLLLLDVMMPAMTGPELWQRVKQDYADRTVPTIFMTAKAEEATSRDLITAGALEVITKPFDPMSLGGQVRDAWTQWHARQG